MKKLLNIILLIALLILNTKQSIKEIKIKNVYKKKINN
jgi:hypothetical protein